MCGLAGIATRDPRRVPELAPLRAMGDALAHRGPDDAGEHVGPGIGLLSRRLAILDLSPLGHMPMMSDDGQVALRFASEMRGLLAEPGFAPEPDPEAIHHLLALRYWPNPATPFSSVYQLPPAHFLIYQEGEIRLQRYWSIPEPSTGEVAKPGLLQERYRVLMDDAVKIRLRSDVPLALLLSGGLDSTAIAYHLRRNLTRSFRAFTIGFSEGDYDERSAAREVAARFGIETVEIEMPGLRIEELAGIVRHMQVPFADPSTVPSWLLAREVSRYVKVALVGDGSAETFGGYDRYRAHLLAARFGWLPGLVSRSPLHALLAAVCAQ